jgi:hypothetical protein
MQWSFVSARNFLLSDDKFPTCSEFTILSVRYDLQQQDELSILLDKLGPILVKYSQK